MQIAICFLGRQQGALLCITCSPDWQALLELSRSVQGQFEGLSTQPSRAREQGVRTGDSGS